eukprot:GILK01003351.1.p1 GENE.GILK01003351.1~~GILK01003351.1.p1  ORF type:complete len:523 (-),score=81.18 GILK01003351.1:109-1677(-)
MFGDPSTNPLLDSTILPNGAPRTINFNRREKQDRVWGFLFTGLFLLVVVFGVTSVATADFWGQQRISQCETDHGSPQHGEEDEQVFTSVKTSTSTYIIVVLVAFVVGSGWVWLLKQYALYMVYASAMTIPLGLVVLSILLLAPGASTAGVWTAVLSLLAAAVICLLLYLFRDKVRLTGAILSESCRALQENMAIMIVSLGMAVSGFLLIGIFFAFGVFMVMNGSVTYDPQSNTCGWEMDEHAKFFLAVLSFMALWSSFLLSYIRMATISGTAAMWYFREGDMRDNKTPTLKALKWAFTSSFGSLCLASLILAVAETLRRIAERARRNDRRSVAAACFAWLADAIASIIGFVNKFAVCYVAITGESFFKSAKATFTMFKRHSIATFVVDRMTSLLLTLNVMVLSALSGVVAYSCLRLSSSHTHQTAVTGAIVSSILALFVYAFYAGIISNLIDAIFVCYVIDMDKKECHQPDVYVVYAQKYPSVNPSAPALLHPDSHPSAYIPYTPPEDVYYGGRANSPTIRM